MTTAPDETETIEGMEETEEDGTIKIITEMITEATEMIDKMTETMTEAEDRKIIITIVMIEEGIGATNEGAATATDHVQGMMMKSAMINTKKKSGT